MERLPVLIANGVVFKWFVAVVDTPLVYGAVWFMKNRLGIEETPEAETRARTRGSSDGPRRTEPRRPAGQFPNVLRMAARTWSFRAGEAVPDPEPPPSARSARPPARPRWPPPLPGGAGRPAGARRPRARPPG